MGAHTDEVARGLLVTEFQLPLDGAQVLLDRRSPDGTEAFSILHDTASGLSVLHRRKGRFVRHELPGPLPLGRATARMEFNWDAPAGHWRIGFGMLTDTGLSNGRLTAQGNGALGLDLPLLADLCEGRAQRHDSVLWFGVTPGTLPRPQAWIGARSPVPTVQGWMPAEDLRPGDLILTESGTVPVLSIARHVVPGRGSFQPVLLRAPWFGLVDVLVSAEQLVRIAGHEAEYLFGEEEVLVPAGLLVDGQSALAEGRRAVVSGVSLNLGGAELITLQGCTLCTDPLPGMRPPLRLLDRYEAVPLMTQLGRLPQRAVG